MSVNLILLSGQIPADSIVERLQNFQNIVQRLSPERLLRIKWVFFFFFLTAERDCLITSLLSQLVILAVQHRFGGMRDEINFTGGMRDKKYFG